MNGVGPDDELPGAAGGEPAGEATPAGASSPAIHASGHLRHALRTPLNHVIGYSELLLEEARERGLEDMAADLRSIHEAGKELLLLIDQLFESNATASSSASTGTPAVQIDGAAEAGGAPSARQYPAGEAPLARLLVVDDNDNNRDLVRRLLEREGYGVSCAGNGAEALERVRTDPPDLILLDVMMPVMNGIDACRRLKDDPETRLTPVVIMTALGDVEDRVRGIEAGADDFLTKPVNRGELLARIQTSLRLKRTVDDKLERLRGTQAFLARFVPQSVIRELERNPGAPAVEKTEQDISALFVDVSGYTRLSENMRQAADFMVEKYFSRFLDAVHDHGGDITETSGDGLMIVFPGAEPREHAVNAVAAGLQILRKTAELNRQLEGIFEPIEVHLGINSGIALIGPTKYEGASGTRWVYTALGPAVNLAARIAGVADPGTICVGPETARRIEGRFATEELGKRQLKNVAGEVVIHRVLPASK